MWTRARPDIRVKKVDEAKPEKGEKVSYLLRFLILAVPTLNILTTTVASPQPGFFIHRPFGKVLDAWMSCTLVPQKRGYHKIKRSPDYKQT